MADEQPTHRIVGVEFGVLSTSELKRLSVTEVFRGCLYDKGIPTDKSFNSLELGTCENSFRCKTCRHDVAKCPGHFGFMKLHETCYHPLFIDHVVKLLRSVCFWCSKLLLDRQKRTKLQNVFPIRNRFTSISSNSKGKRCLGCMGFQPSFVRNGMFIKMDWPKTTVFESDEEEAFAKINFSAERARIILRDVSDEDACFCGINPRVTHLESLVLTHIPIPPPIIRPAVAYQAGSRLRGQEDLTLKLIDIGKSNESLKKAKTQKEKLRHLEALQLHINLYIDKDLRPTREKNQSRGKGPRMGGNRSLIARFKGKKGRFRCHMIGKRVDFTSRGVITGDSSIDIDEVGIPHRIALTQTIPEIVTDLNIKDLRQRVENGPSHLHGATMITLVDGSMVNLSMRRSSDSLRIVPGCIVHRTLRDGDWLVVNRQPTLHKGSMMAHRAKIIDGESLKLSLCVTTPYNADFDGDEMNIHCPQSWKARTELSQMMAVGNHIVTDASSRPTITMVQDCLIAVYLMTKRDILFDDSMAKWVLGNESSPPRYYGIGWRTSKTSNWNHRYSGKQILSQLLAPINLQRQVRGSADMDIFTFDKNETTVYIRNGALLCGRLCKESMNGSGGIIHITCKDFGNREAKRFMSKGGRLLHRWFESYGFSIGIDDISCTEESYTEVNKIINVALENIEKANDTYIKFGCHLNHRIQLENHTIKTLQDVLPRCGQSILEGMHENNALRCMAKGCGSGSKGSKMNIAQMAALVGQQMVNGRRVPGYSSINCRSLPMFPKDTLDPLSHGFCVHPYTIGVTPAEFFFHAQGGREGLVDTAVKTASTGYIHRRLATYMKHHAVQYDGSVRNYHGEIISFFYGGDGFKADKLEKIYIDELIESDIIIQSRYGLEIGNEVIRLRKLLMKNRLRSNSYPTKVTVPINVKRIALNIMIGVGKIAFSNSDIMAIVKWVDGQRGICASGLTSTKMAIVVGLARLRTHTIIQQKKIIWIIKQEILNSLCPPGYMAGTVAAQSIGEPTTQMTLNSFHLAGVASEMVMTSGVKRLKECIDISKNIATPSCAFHTNITQKSLISITHVGLCDVVEDSYVLEDIVPEAYLLHKELQMTICKEHISKFVGCVQLNQVACKDFSLTNTDICYKIQQFFKDIFITIVSTEDCENEWTIFFIFYKIDKFLRLKEEDFKSSSDMETCLKKGICQFMKSSIKMISLSGVPNVQSYTVIKKNILTEKADGSYQDLETDVIITKGSNLKQLINLEYINNCSILSNCLHEVCEVLGIEVAMRILFSEIEKVLGSDGNYIDPRHIWLLARSITRFGYMAPVSRHGMRKLSMGTLVLASYEETRSVFKNAAVFGAVDKAQGVTQALIFGNVPPLGTGFGFEILPQIAI